MSGVDVVSSKKNHEKEMWGGNSGSLFHFPMGVFLTVLEGVCSFVLSFALMYSWGCEYLFSLANETNHARLSDTIFYFLAVSSASFTYK